jgi:TRAP-type C4-dicarboxylate transport system permease small subunit
MVSVYARVVNWLAIGGGLLAVLCLTALALLVFAEIVLASASKIIPGFQGDIPIAWEYSGYLMGTAFMLGSAVTLRAGSHIRVTALLSILQPRARRVAEVMATSVATLFSGFLAWTLIVFTARSVVDGNVSFASFTPLWIPQAGMAIGATLLTLVMFERLIASFLDLPLEDKSLKVGTFNE